MRQISMKAAGEIIIEHAEKPVPQKGEALLRVLYGGICGSDLSSYRGTMRYITYPRVPGHEFSAEIVEVEPNDYGLHAGMLVTANPYFNCGKCYSCQNGLVNCCTTSKTMGIQREGAFAEYITLPIERIYNGKNIAAKTLALVEPFCISYHGVKRLNLQKDEKVLIVGAGTIGVLAAVAAMAAGAEVTICDVAADKLEYAKKFGIHHTICNTSPDVFIQETASLTNGNGFDVTIEAVGIPATFQNCIDAVCFGGRMLQIGVGKQNADFFFTSIQQKELMIMGSRNARKEDFLEAIDMLNEGKLNIDKVITNIYKLDQAAKAFEDFHKHGNSMLKVLIDFT